MNPNIEYLKGKPQISNVIAQGFAQIYYHKPQFPVTFLGQYLKNYNELQHQKKQLIRKLVNNQTIKAELKKRQENQQKLRIIALEQKKRNKQKQEGFEFRINECSNFDQFLNQYCQWIEKEKSLTGVYIGELQHQFKNINFDKQDGEQVHIDNEAPKIIKFKFASNSHNSLIIGKTLAQESVIGKLLSQKPEQAGGEEQEGKKQAKPKGQIYVPKVQQDKELFFFKYPRLGSFYAVVMKIKSYLHQKIFDANIVKTQTYRKAKEEYDKEQEERETKFRQQYDQKAASGADEKELQELESAFEKEEENFPKPKIQEYEFVLREFVVCFDTLGLDREISKQQRDYYRNMVEYLKEHWQSKEKELLQKDIDNQLKQNVQNLETPLQDLFVKLVQQQDKQLPANEEVEKNKNNQKMFELQMNTLRIQKIHQYFQQEKYVAYLQSLLDRTVIKYPQIMKLFYIFAGFKKQDFTFKGTNIMNWRKAKLLMTKEEIITKINQFIPRGSKPSVVVKPYAKWQRILKSLEKYEQNTVAAYNIVLAFILRFLQLSGKVRIGDRQARKAAAKLQRQAREQKIKEVQAKALEKQQKMASARAEAQAKEEVFDEQSWLRTYEEQNPPIQIGEEVVQEKDEDLQQQVIEPPPQ